MATIIHYVEAVWGILCDEADDYQEQHLRSLGAFKPAPNGNGNDDAVPSEQQQQQQRRNVRLVGTISSMDSSSSSSSSSTSSTTTSQSQSTVLHRLPAPPQTFPPKSTMYELDEQVLEIAVGAAQIKRAETMAAALLDDTLLNQRQQSARLRGLLLSVMDDWRALAIRTVACLYRLEGVLEATSRSVMPRRTVEATKAARQALRVYAPLAQRLGMQRLKAKIEDAAFRILYRKQFRVAEGLYHQSGPALKAMSRYLETQITQALLSHPQLMGQVEALHVTSRVKEPYSSWKKLLKTQLKLKLRLPSSVDNNSRQSSSLSSSVVLSSRAARAQQGQRQQSSSSPSSTKRQLSLVDVQDAVALRVILKARKLTDDEPPEVTLQREKVLCYVVQHILREQWPVLDESRIKDYIESPKDNGYQSLHYTSYIASQGIEWPFEVQVCC